MSSLKKHLPLILMAMLILIMMPMSFAAENTDMNATDAVGINDADSVDADALSADESDNPVESSSDDESLNAGYDYQTVITTPSDGVVNDYHKGDDVQLMVTANFDSAYYIGNDKMYAYINGAESGVAVKTMWTTDILGDVRSFGCPLSQFDDYLTQPSNTIVFHPNPAYMQWDNFENNDYGVLTVNMASDATSYDYVSEPTVPSIDYTMGENTTVSLIIFSIFPAFSSSPNLL